MTTKRAQQLVTTLASFGGAATDCECMCDFGTTCGGDHVLLCLGCGGDQCVCAACFGQGEAPCWGCEDCKGEDL